MSAASLVQFVMSLPVWLVIITTGLVCFISTGGLPVPVTLMTVLAGSYAVHAPAPFSMFALLWLVISLANSSRDTVAFVLLRSIWRWSGKSDGPDSPETRGLQHVRSYASAIIRRVNSPAVQRACMAMQRRQRLILNASRLTPITPIFNMGAVLIGLHTGQFWRSIFPGRLLNTLLLMGIGAMTGTAFSVGTIDWPRLLGYGVSALLVLSFVPSLIARHILMGQKELGESRSLP